MVSVVQNLASFALNLESVAINVVTVAINLVKLQLYLASYSMQIFIILQLEILSLFQKVCRRLICPFPKTPFYGTCIQLVKNILGLTVHINFKLTVLGNVSAPHVNENKFETAKALHNAFSIELKNAKCLFCNMTVMRQFESVATPLQFYILPAVYTTSQCQYHHITKLVSDVLAKEIKVTMPGKSSLSVRANIDKRSGSQIQSVAEYLYRGSTVICHKTTDYRVRSGMFCPQIEIDRSEMSYYVERAGKSKRALFEEGKIEEVSYGSIRICKDEYFAVLEQTSSAVRLILDGSSIITLYVVLGCILYILARF